MSRPPYRGFTPLNRRRHELIVRKHEGGGLADDEERELEMLQTVCGAMVRFRHPMSETLRPELRRLLAEIGEARP